MALKKQGKYWYGDDHTDVRAELESYSRQNAYPIDNYVDVKCKCGKDRFYLLTDEDAGVAVRQCVNCGDEHLMGDSADYSDEAEVGQHECICEKDKFEIVAGIHRYRNDDNSLSDDVRWLYIGCRCPSCGLVGCYADWKNEFNDYAKLLELM
jgi:hypothetical protein